MAIFILPGNIVMGFDPDQVVPENAIPIPDTFDSVHYPYLQVVNGTVTHVPTTASIAQQAADISYSIQKLLDTTAQSRQYNDIKSACAYASPIKFEFPVNATPAQITITNLQEKSRLEGNALQLWMSLAWATINQYLTTVDSGVNNMPAIAVAIAMIPEFTWPE